MTRRLTVPLLSLAVLAAACGGGGTDTPEVARKVREKALAPRPVRLTTPEVREEHPTLELVGQLRSDELVTVSAEVAGRIDAVLVDVGDSVTKGQPLAKIDRSTWKVRLEQAEAELGSAVANLALAEKELRRKRDLLSDKTISQAAFDKVQAQYDLAVAAVKKAQAANDLATRNWERSLVRAPSAGKVARRDVSPGEWTDLGEPIVELSTGQDLKVSARVPERFVSTFKGIQSFTFTVGEEGPRLTARIFSIEPVVEGSSRSFEITGRTKNPGGKYRPGMFAKVRLEAPTVQRSLWLPRTAVIASDMPEIMLVEDGKTVVRKVQTGRRQHGKVEIISGLRPDEQVIADVAGLARGIPVKVTNRG